MEAIEAILTRRSVRTYADRPVPDHLVTEILRAAMAAPSARNEQPWEFVVVRERSALDQMAAVSPYAGMLRHVQVAIVVCGDLEREKSPGFWVQDCAAATENLLIAAHALGLGAVWLGIYPREERVTRLRRLAGLPEHVVPLAIISIGYPAERPEPVERFDASRIHLDHW